MRRLPYARRLEHRENNWIRLLMQTVPYIISCMLCITAFTLLAVWFLRKRDIHTDRE